MQIKIFGRKLWKPDAYSSPFVDFVCKKQLLEESKYDLVLLDYEMPGKSGFDVFKAMKVQSETRDIPVVFF